MKRIIKIIPLGGILAVAGIGGTFAYFNQTHTKTNEFTTGTYDTVLVEDFRPEDGENWKPGATVNKDVTVKNEGTLPVVVRVKFQETWVRRSDSFKLYDVDTTLQKEKTGLGATPDARNKFENVYQQDPGDGNAGTEIDDSVVHKIMDPDQLWIYNPADGYYYYKQILPGKQEGGEAPETARILDGVRLDENIDMGAYIERKYYACTESEEPPAKDSSDWVEFEKDETTANGYVTTAEMAEIVQRQGKKITFLKASPELKGEELGGYRDADYTLRVTAQTVQATDGAVAGLFGDIGTFKALGCQWELMSEDTLYQGDAARP